MIESKNHTSWNLRFFIYESKFWGPLRITILSALDSIFATAALYLTFVMRLESWDIGSYLVNFTPMAMSVSFILIVVNHISGVYKTSWRHANLASGILITMSCLVTSICFFGLMNIIDLYPPVPKSVPPLLWMMTTLFLCSYKFVWKVLSNIEYYTRSSQGKPRCLIYGAGHSGRLLAKHLVHSATSPYALAGFIDDDPSLTNKLIEGTRVYSGQRNLKHTIEKLNIKKIIVAVHSVPGEVLRRIHQCVPNYVDTLVMPHLTESLQSDLSELRSINIKDLLRRSTQKDSSEQIRRYYYNRSILVTGAGGSIGSELCRQLLEAGPAELIILDVSEYNLYKIEAELTESNQNTQIIPILASVSCITTLDRVFNEYMPNIVIHAAAYKHVPLVECNKIDGIINNILGTRNVLDCVVKYKCRKFMLVSTDKAVNPTNTMGATKRICELLVQCYQKEYHHLGVELSLVRFGNVLGSSGSVIPKFLDQIKRGGPVTVTHKDVTRYFMLIDEAVNLILKSLSISKGGEAFILDMGNPIKIVDMAKDLIKLSGKSEEDIDIVFSGLRPGEKLFEELLLEGSETITKYDNIFVAKPENLPIEKTLSDISNMIDQATHSDIQCLGYLETLGDLVIQSPSETLVSQSRERYTATSKDMDSTNILDLSS